MPTCAEEMARSLRDAGVEVVFGLPGGEVLDLVEACRRAGLRFLLTRHEATASLSIPDADPAGVTTAIAVPATATGTTAELTVEVDVTHTYVGDLHVTLTHAGRTAVLHDRSGGNTDDLHIRASISDFAGTPRAGDWTLSVVDDAAEDVGTLTGWAIEL